jgi:Flp pilus assembly protein TadD
MQKDYANSIADIGKVLTREPRHFGALSGLGLIMQDIGDEKRALDAYRKALEVYPRQEGMAEKVKSLTEKVDGREL